MFFYMNKGFLFLFIFLISCRSEIQQQNIYEVLCDSIASNYLSDGQNLILANSVDGSGYHTANFIEGEGYSKMMKQIADSLFMDSIRLNFNIEILDELSLLLTERGFKVTVYESFEVNSLSLDSNASMICFSKQFVLNDEGFSGGYLCFLHHSSKISRGFYYGVTDHSFWMDQIWATDYSKSYIEYPLAGASMLLVPFTPTPASPSMQK